MFTVAGLSELAALRDLRQLVLAGSAIDDAGWLAVAEIGSLAELNAPRSNLNDANLMHLKKLRKLEKVDVKDSAVTAEGAAAFQKARPEVEVLR